MKKWINTLGLILQILLVASTAIAEEENNRQGETPSGVAFSELEKVIDDYADKYVGVSTPGAAVAVIKDGTMVFSKGYGYGDLKAAKAVDSPSTIFEWGSITKDFTWTALMQLEERGRLNLGDDIAKYLPEQVADKFKGSDAITIMDLMNHTTGFGDYGFDLIATSPEDCPPLLDALLKSHPDNYLEVGNTSAYSNYGTGIAGLIIEEVTGLSYNQYLAENFFAPLEMDSTSADPLFRVSQEMKNSKAQGYIANVQGGFDLSSWSYVGLAPAGSLNGTVEDLARFASALIPEDGKTPLFQKRDTLDRMLSNSYVNMAHGFFEYDGEVLGYGHGGNTAGFTGQFIVVPKERFAVITLTNVAGEKDFAYGIQELLTGKRDYTFDSTEQNLPNPYEVEGRYISFRRPEGSYLKLMSYMSPFTITATGNNEVTLSMATYHQSYVQTSPYHYEIAGNDTPLFNIMFSDLHFELEQGEVIQLTAGRGFDLQPINQASSSFIRLGSLMVLMFFILVGLLSAVLTAVALIKGRKKNLNREQRAYNRLQLGLKLLGGLIMTTNAMALELFLQDNFRTFSEVRPLLLLNYLWTALLLTGSFFSYRFEKSCVIPTFRKGVDRFYNLLSFLMIAVLFYWDFFTIHGW